MQEEPLAVSTYWCNWYYLIIYCVCVCESVSVPVGCEQTTGSEQVEVIKDEREKS